MTSKTNGKGAPGATAHENKAGETPAEPKVLTPLEEQIKFFEGLAQLVGVKRRFEKHREAITDLSFPDEELSKFENEKRYGIRIEIYDNDNDAYTINNPRLVKEVQEFLLAKINTRIAEYDQSILTYGK